MAEDDGLCDGEGGVKITQRFKFVLLVLTDNVELLDVVQRLLFTSQPNDIWIGNNLLCKLPHRVLKGGGEKEHLAVLHQLSVRERRGRGGDDSDHDQKEKNNRTHLWIRMLWSRWPCVAIITSASSSTNMLIFLGSMILSLVHQSRTVPGVPMTICSCNLTPRSSEHDRQTQNAVLSKINSNYDHILTSSTTNCIHQFDIRTILPHVLDDLTDLQSELVCW